MARILSQAIKQDWIWFFQCNKSVFPFLLNSYFKRQCYLNLQIWEIQFVYTGRLWAVGCRPAFPPRTHSENSFSSVIVRVCDRP